MNAILGFGREDSVRSAGGRESAGHRKEEYEKLPPTGGSGIRERGESCRYH